jgi:hypothetical protein
MRLSHQSADTQCSRDNTREANVFTDDGTIVIPACEQGLQEGEDRGVFFIMRRVDSSGRACSAA